MTAHSPIETVLAAYGQTREPVADVLANVINEHALHEYQHSMLSRMTRARRSPDDSASHGIPPSVRNAVARGSRRYLLQCSFNSSSRTCRFETRRIEGRWVVWTLEATSLALPGTSGFAF